MVTRSQETSTLIQITYTGQQISNNQMKSLHWRELKKVIDPVKLKMFALVRNAKLPKINTMHLLVRYNSRLDCDNVSATVKVFVDTLVKCKVLPNDTKKHWPLMTIMYDPDLNTNTAVFEVEVFPAEK